MAREVHKSITFNSVTIYKKGIYLTAYYRFCTCLDNDGFF